MSGVDEIKEAETRIGAPTKPDLSGLAAAEEKVIFRHRTAAYKEKIAIFALQIKH